MKEKVVFRGAFVPQLFNSRLVDFFIEFITLGKTNAINKASITITANSSINVNPFCFITLSPLFILYLFYILYKHYSNRL